MGRVAQFGRGSSRDVPIRDKLVYTIDHVRYYPADIVMKDEPMTTAETFERARTEPALLWVAGMTAGLAASVYIAQAWIADSPYGFELSHRPLWVALWATTLLIDWSEGIKIVVVLGTSLAVMIDSGRRLFGRLPRAAR
jgi:hypothetical protein